MKRTAIGASLLMTLAACGSDGASSAATTSTTTATPVGAYDSALAFDKTKYTTINVTIDGVKTPVRWYKKSATLASRLRWRPARWAWRHRHHHHQHRLRLPSMNIFVPESVAASQDAAIYFAVNNAGWAASYIKASVADGGTFDSSTSNVGAALKAGYVYIDVATRGRGIVAADGSYAGKAPAAIVDAKAAVRYLRLNDSAMPGNANHIVVTAPVVAAVVGIGGIG
jgi:hypothetical protein